MALSKPSIIVGLLTIAFFEASGVLVLIAELSLEFDEFFQFVQ